MTSGRRRRPLVVRVFDRQLARSVEHTFGFQHVRSTSALAAPWFVGAALGLDVLDTFYVEQQPFLLARLTIALSGGLQGTAMHELSGKTRVVALHRLDGALEHPPRRDTIFAAGDQAFLVGPYEELLQVLLSNQNTAVSESGAR
jgi:Trk K+ transport system NAD-binding subunit